MIRELDKLPTTGIYRMYGKSRDKQPKEEVLAEALKHSDDVIWIEKMGAAFIPYRNEKRECVECGKLMCDCVVDAEKFIAGSWTMDDYESEGE